MSNILMGLEEFHTLHPNLGTNEVVLDVRQPDEYSAGHIPDSLNIPLDQVATQVQALKKYSKIYIHCKRGGRAKTAFDQLTGMGLTNLVCIHDGGMDMWMEKGYPVV